MSGSRVPKLTRMRRSPGLRVGALVAALAASACALIAVLAPAAAHAAQADTSPGAGRSALIVLLPVDLEEPPPGVQRPTVASLIDGHPELALGLISATQSGYSPEQALLDVSSGTRTSRGTYSPKEPPPMSLLPIGDGRPPADGGGPAPTSGQGLIVNWLAAVMRADTALADIRPGLLAGAIAGGAAYAGIAGQTNAEAAIAADRDGRVAAISLGRAGTVAARAQALLERHRLVVALLPPGYAGDHQLDQLIAARKPGQLLIVMQAPPPFTGPQLLWAGIAGLGPADAGFTSDTTHIDGVAAGIDLAPTILQHLGLPVPDAMRGRPIRIAGARDAGALQRLDERLAAVPARRIPALQTFLFTWLGIVLAAGIVRDRVGVRFALRVGGLALLWLPSMVLLAAALAPSEQGELFLIAGGSFALAIATDRLLRWPRGPAAPALVALVAYTADLVNHSHLVIRSLLGPSPRSGSRFYGFGNELEIAITIVMLVALAAVLRHRGRSRANALAFALGGLALAAIMGSGRLGADVGGIFTVGGGAAVAVLMLLPGGVTRRAVALAVATPLLGLAGLAALDLATGGNGHFVRNVLHDDVGGLLDTFQRRYELAWTILTSGYAPLLTALCALAVGYALAHRDRVYAAIRDDAVWRAALGGGLAASISGALFNDSGPLLLFIGVVALGFVTAYLRAAPDGRGAAPSAPAASASGAGREPLAGGSAVHASG